MNCRTFIFTLLGVLLLTAVIRADPKKTCARCHGEDETSIAPTVVAPVFVQSCAPCHGKDGRGQTPMGQKLGCRDYTNAKIQAGLKQATAFKAIKEGLKNADGKILMQPAEGLSDDEIRALVDYLADGAKSHFD